MRLNIKDIEKIIDHDWLSWSRKSQLIELYFNKIRANQVQDTQDRIIEILNDRCSLLRTNRLFLYRCSDSDAITLETEEYENNNRELISYETFQNDYFICEDCDEVSNLDNREWISTSERQVCYSCFERSYRYCDDCDTSCHENENCNCDDYYDEDEESDDNLKAYNYRVKQYNLGYSKKRYGIELENETREYNRDDIVEMINDTMNVSGNEYIVCKRDGSLDADKGFEIVSTNADFYYHKNIFWNDFFNLNLHESCKGYHGANCGMHIHINRDTFSDFQQRILNLFYHSPINKKFIVDLAGREDKQYARFIETTSFHDDLRPQSNSNDSNGYNYKFRSLNLCNANTIEIRIFRSNLKKISFFKNIEFVDSVCEWVLSEFKSQDDFIKNSDLSDIDFIIKEKIHYHNYLDWLIKNVNRDYSNLYFYLDKKEIFNHLEYFEDFKNQYITFKTMVQNFTNSESEFIEQESEND